MHHRCFTRFDAGLSAELFHRDRSLGRFSIRDICIDGMFIETEDADADLCRNDIVRVRIPLFGEQYAMRGLVVRRTASGVGLMVADLDLEYYESIAKLLAAYGPAGSIGAEFPARGQKVAQGRSR